MVDAVQIKGGFSLDLGEVKRDAKGNIDLNKSISAREVEAMVNHAKAEIGAADFERRKANFEFRLKEKDGRVYFEYKERSAFGHLKASFGIRSAERQSERDNAIKAISNAYNLEIKSLSGVKDMLGGNATNFEAAKNFHSTIISTLQSNRALIAHLTSNPVKPLINDQETNASLDGIVKRAIKELIENPFADADQDFVDFATRQLGRTNKLAPIIRNALEAHEAAVADQANLLNAEAPGLMNEKEAIAIAVNAVKQKISSAYKVPDDILSALTNPSFDGLSFLEALDRMVEDIDFAPEQDQTAHIVSVSENTFRPLLQSKSDSELAELFEATMSHMAFMSATLANAGLSGRMILDREGYPDPNNADEHAAQLQMSRNASRLGDVSTTLLFELIKEMKGRGQLEQPDELKDLYIFDGRTFDFNKVEMQNPFFKENIEFIEDFGKRTIQNGGSTTQALADIRLERG